MTKRGTRGWTRLRRIFPSVLANLRPEVSRVNLGRGKGVFFHLIVGPVKNHAEAQRACRHIKRSHNFANRPL